MIVVAYNGQKLVVDPETGFVMDLICYEHGNNCYTCTERVIDGCIVDEVEIDDLIKSKENK